MTTSISSRSRPLVRRGGAGGVVLRLVGAVASAAVLCQVRGLASFLRMATRDDERPLSERLLLLSSSSWETATTTTTTPSSAEPPHSSSAFSGNSSNLGVLNEEESLPFLNNEPNSNNNNNLVVVHVVRTRFQQQQPHLLHLGRARLALFEQFCLPSIIVAQQEQPQPQQDDDPANHNHNNATATAASPFIWIIRTDPDLHPALKRELLHSVRPHPHVFVVPSNRYPDGFRREAGELVEGELWSGSRPLLQNYRDAAQTRAVLETRLDADDGLAAGYLAAVQRRAVRALQQQAQKKEEDAAGSSNRSTAIRSSSNNHKHWRVWCAESVLEWQMLGGGGAHHHRESRESNSESAHRGAWREVTSRVCETPGLTWLYGVNATPKDRPTGAHHRIYSAVPACRSEADLQCYERVRMVSTTTGGGSNQAAAIRARTPTSAGMKDIALLDDNSNNNNNNNNRNDGNDKGDNNTALVLLLEQQQQQQQQEQNKYWRDVRRRFAVNETAVRNVRRELRSNLRAIVEEALQGQCLPGGVPGTCKPASAAQLNRLLASLSAEDKQQQQQQDGAATSDN